MTKRSRSEIPLDPGPFTRRAANRVAVTDRNGGGDPTDRTDRSERSDPPDRSDQIDPVESSDRTEPADPPGPSDAQARVTSAVDAHLRSAHRPILEQALACADAVAVGWDGDATNDRREVVDPYETLLRRSGLDGSLVEALADAVSAAGLELAARPVPEVPYLAVTARGVVVRGPTVEGRVVVTLDAFEVDHGADTVYRRGPDLPEALEVEWRTKG